MLDASVIICTHNPRREYLERAIGALRVQTVASENWELIVIDNGSVEPVSTCCDLSWHPHGRHVFEAELGLSAARQRGITESSGRLLVFVDDDNVLAPDYLAQTLRIERDFHFLGAWGSGSISLEFEAKPADHLDSLLPWLGLRHVAKPVWSNSIACSEATPIGAGLCLKREVGNLYQDFYKSSQIQIPGRKGNSLGAHEDFEICYLACNTGLGMGVFPELKILHLIEKSRTTDAHILRLVESVTLSKLMLEHKWGRGLPRSPMSVLGAASFTANIFARRGFDRRVYFAELRAVLSARRQLAALVGL